MDIETTKTVAEVAANSGDLAVLAKAIIIGFGVMGPAIGLGLIFSKGLEGISRNPQAAGKITP
jgi:F0F1-type ATP synthase membrane subunit c/vacuolar-type H+-ATPase subunit K